MFTSIQESAANEVDYVDLGLASADACKAFDRGANRRCVDEIRQSAFEVIVQFTL